MTTFKTDDPALNFYLEQKADEREHMRERLREKHPGWGDILIEAEILEMEYRGDDLMMGY